MQEDKVVRNFWCGVVRNLIKLMQTTLTYVSVDQTISVLQTFLYSWPLLYLTRGPADGGEAVRKKWDVV
jgi:hypothetical protein